MTCGQVSCHTVVIRSINLILNNVVNDGMEVGKM